MTDEPSSSHASFSEPALSCRKITANFALRICFRNQASNHTVESQNCLAWHQVVPIFCVKSGTVVPVWRVGTSSCGY